MNPSRLNPGHITTLLKRSVNWQLQKLDYDWLLPALARMPLALANILSDMDEDDIGIDLGDGSDE